MPQQTRRDVLKSGALLTAAALLEPQALLASPLGLPLGLQLYSVRELLPKDYDGTLKQIAAIGYQEVEAAGFFHHSAAEVKHSMQAAGLQCVSAHYALSDLHQRLDEVIAFHRELGADYIICASPGLKNPTDAHPAPSLTIDDWRWNAEEFNKMGAKVKAAGMHFGYHNHVAEFHKQDGVTPYDELLRLTDPALVTFEMDCGWVTVGGGDPIDYLRKQATRISMLHVKDFKPPSHLEADGSAKSASDSPQAAELGRGTVNFTGIFQAADKANIKHYFVEQEAFNLPPFESLKIDADFIKGLNV